MFVTQHKPCQLRSRLNIIMYAAILGLMGITSQPLHAEERIKEQPPELAQASNLGGRFMLEDHNGKIVTDQDFQGRFLLITFGYTYCPDVCPTNLVNMSNAMDELGDLSSKIAPIFITVDPSRDTAVRLHDYVASFDERLIGLTGPQQMIDSVTKRYKVVSDVHRPKDWEEGEYLIDHTASIFLMAPDGQFLVKFAHGMDPKDMAKRIKEFLGA